MTPHTRFLGSVQKRRRKEQWPRKGRSDLERAPRPRKSTSSYWRSDLEVSCPQKPNGDAPDSVSWFRPKTPRERHNGLERDDRTWNGVRGLESLHLATNWFNIEVSCNKSRTVTPQTRFLGTAPKRRRKAQWPRKGRPDLERGPRPRKSTSSYWVVRSQSFLPTKAER